MGNTEKQYKQLSAEERATIMLMTREGKGVREVGRFLNPPRVKGSDPSDWDPQKNACHCRNSSLAFCALFWGMPTFLRAPSLNCVNWNGTYSQTAL